MDDPAVAESEDGHLVNALEAAPGRGLTEPFPKVGGRAGEAADDLVALGDQPPDDPPCSPPSPMLLCCSGSAGPWGVHDDRHPGQAQAGAHQVVAVGPEAIDQHPPGQGAGHEHPTIGGQDAPEMRLGPEGRRAGAASSPRRS
jgi:hypothetical protein